MARTKPRFLIEDGRLVLLKNSLPHLNDYRSLLDDEHATISRLGAYDYFFQTSYRRGALDKLASVRLLKVATHTLKERFAGGPIFLHGTYNPGSEAFLVTKKIFETFYLTALKNNTLPIILLLPNADDLLRMEKHQPKRYKPLLDYFQNRRFRYFDCSGAFQHRGTSIEIKNIFLPSSFGWSHYNPLGHHLIAQHLFDYLQKHDLLTLSGVSAALESEQALHSNSDK